MTVIFFWKFNLHWVQALKWFSDEKLTFFCCCFKETRLKKKKNQIQHFTVWIKQACHVLVTWRKYARRVRLTWQVTLARWCFSCLPYRWAAGDKISSLSPTEHTYLSSSSFNSSWPLNYLVLEHRRFKKVVGQKLVDLELWEGEKGVAILGSLICVIFFNFQLPHFECSSQAFRKFCQTLWAQNNIDSPVS